MPDMPDEYFFYMPNDNCKTFPIDYSFDELARKWSTADHSVDPRTICKYLFNRGPLKKTFLDFAGTDQETPQADNEPRSKKKWPLPVEIEPFLQSFFNLATSCRSYKALFKEKPSQQADVMDEFSTEFCQKLGDAVCQLPEIKGADPTAFCRHVLFKNNSFSAIVMSHQLKDQIGQRINLIQHLCPKVPFEIQAAALQDCLMALDRICLDLKCAVQTDFQQPVNTPPRPEELLAELLDARQKLRVEESTYRIKNIEVPVFHEEKQEARRLKDLFPRLSSTKFPDEELMKQTRIGFQRYIGDTIEPSAFERKYLELLDYLNFSGTKLDEKTLITDISDEIKRSCLPVIEDCCMNRNYGELKNIQECNILKKYYTVFLSQDGEAYVQESIKILKNILSFADRANLYYDCLAYFSKQPSSSERDYAIYSLNDYICLNVFQPFNTWLTSVWCFLHSENEVDFQWSKDILYVFQKEGYEAADFFGVSNILRLYNTWLKNAFGAESYNVVEKLQAVCKILTLGIIQILRKIVESAAPQIARGVKLFQEYQATPCN